MNKRIERFRGFEFLTHRKSLKIKIMGEKLVEFRGIAVNSGEFAYGDIIVNPELVNVYE
jgi:hypothetical protein